MEDVKKVEVMGVFWWVNKTGWGVKGRCLDVGCAEGKVKYSTE